MTDEQLNGESQPAKRTPNQPANVALRSDAILESMKPGGSGSRQKTIGLIIGVIALLLVVGLGVYAALRPPSEGGGDDSEGIFSNLPLADLASQRPAEGRYSGRQDCPDPDRRAVAVMMPSDPVVRPVSGFSTADMVWELPVLVSNVTRLMAVYQCGQPTEIGSVRSARHDYLFVAEGLDSVLGHWGGSYHALNRIDVGEFQTLNALGNPFNTFYRKNTLPAPHNGFTDYERMWNAVNQLDLRTTTDFDAYTFQDDGPAEERPAGGTLSVAWPGAYRVTYEYNAETNRYERYWAGVRQVDAENGQVEAPSSVVIMRASNGPQEGPGGYNDVGVEGEGVIEVYQDGKVITGTWRKSEIHKSDPVHFMNEQGDPIRFTRGQIWVMTPSDSIEVTWEPQEAAETTL